MNMQTGPARNQTMAQWLVWTGALELINIVLLGVVFARMTVEVPMIGGTLATVGYATLAIILLEGGLYWWFKRWDWADRWTPQQRLALLVALYRVNYVVLLVFPALLLVSWTTNVVPFTPGAAIFGTLWYLFGLGEFIHYFVWKINMRSTERRRQRATRRRIPARFRRELDRLRHATSAG